MHAFAARLPLTGALATFLAATALTAFLFTGALAPTPAAASLVGTASAGIALAGLEAGGSETEGDTGYDFGVSLGWQMNDWLRWDALEFHYMSADLAGGASTNDNLVAGTGVRIGLFERGRRFYPYVSAGIGGSRVGHQVGPAVDYEWGLEWNAGGGVEFQLDHFTAVGVRYRYRSAKVEGLDALPAGDIRLNFHTLVVEFAFGGE